jgi:hypothetical protein
MTDTLAPYNPPCWHCNWHEYGYQADSHTNCRDTCDEYEDYRLLMLAKGIEVIS